MKSSLLAVALAVAAGLTGVDHAAAGDSITFRMVRPASATCLPADAHARVTVTDLGSVQNMHLEVFSLTPNTEFTLFVTQHNARPFGLAWYQGDVKTGSDGRGAADFSGIFSEESFIVSDTPIQMYHLGIWYADATDAANAGCSNTVTPFDGDHAGGILALSTANFPDAKGPLLKLKEIE